MSKLEEIKPPECPTVNLDHISQQLIAGSLHSVPFYIGLDFAKERNFHLVEKQSMEEVIKDLKVVRDELKEINEQLNKELGQLSAQKDKLVFELNEQSAGLEGLLKALGKRPTTNNVVLDLAIAIAELQTKGNKNV